MTKLPYTYTDRDGDQLIIGDDVIAIVGQSDGALAVTCVSTPSEEDAVHLIRAILSLSRVTGYMFLGVEEIGKIRRASVLRGAVSMRERAVECAEDVFPSEAIGEIRALSLLPDGEDTSPPSTKSNK